MRSLRAQRSQQAALALEREKAEKYALVQHALADAVSHTLLVPNSKAFALRSSSTSPDEDEASQRGDEQRGVGATTSWRPPRAAGFFRSSGLVLGPESVYINTENMKRRT